MVASFALRNKAAMERTGLKIARKRAGLTQGDIAEKMGVSIPQISRWESGKDGIPSQRLTSMAAAYQSNLEELLGEGIGDAPTNAVAISFEGAASDDARPNLPIYGTALGVNRNLHGEAIEQTTLNRGEVLEYAKRPTLLNRRKDAYGLYIQGSSMHPALPDGEMVAVVPGMPLSIGDNVVVYLRPSEPEEDDGQTARAVLVKELVRRSASHVVLRQYSPPADFTIEMDDVLRIDRVLTRREMLS